MIEIKRTSRVGLESARLRLPLEKMKMIKDRTKEELVKFRDELTEVLNLVRQDKIRMFCSESTSALDVEIARAEYFIVNAIGRKIDNMIDYKEGR